MKNHVDDHPQIVRTFSQKVIYHRHQKNISQQDLAEIVNIHINTLSKIERGISIPSLPIAMKLSRLLDISLDEMLLLIAKEVRI